MITIFNRKELIITYDLVKQAELRNLLAGNNIKYLIKTRNQKSPSPFTAASIGRTGTFGENLSLEYEYKIYVHKDDYNEALSIVKKSL
ncbi:hypothetical protein SAMN02746066_01003 [Anaerosporobacter mobilis DSM 15930]|uniref:Signal transducing protein n=1 Tax=Anaerosporobacter mobilis DSM 15930 TaxID=1120996 RepID=A0A1M7GMF1_9FIRM|nr:hypothetical protein [Anaerosporobacter mobilis]SHM17366.1 hypothetical protein SAMN02746066_01003 [Anaerosporobacter mobilis DSM 15930]